MATVAEKLSGRVNEVSKRTVSEMTFFSKNVGILNLKPGEAQVWIDREKPRR
jgi:hypothetical protein